MLGICLLLTLCFFELPGSPGEYLSWPRAECNQSMLVLNVGGEVS